MGSDAPPMQLTVEKPRFGGRRGHINLLGAYDFSEDKLKDWVGIKPPKLTD